ncbi:MAG TPA: adenylate kinase [Nitrososphaeraceae archaeon]|nr:adenylate kinase [Nitrososphaeraceae archaeon]
MVENNNNKRVVIVGIPGVGKTSIVSLVSEKLGHKELKATVAVFGTVMLEEAGKIGVKNRDELRKLSLAKQRQLQEMAAKRIAQIKDSTVIIDTHLFVKTIDGYYPGLPMHVLDIIKPTHFVMVVAEAGEIVKRRKADKSRDRDIVSTQDIQYELDILRIMVASCSMLTGSPFIVIMNNDNKIENAVLDIVKVLCDR